METPILYAESRSRRPIQSAEQTVLIRQISGAVNGLQFRVQDLEEAVKALQKRLGKRGD